MVAPVKPYTELALICFGQRISRPAAYLQSKLTSVQNSAFERIFLHLEIGLGSFTCTKEILQDMRQQPFPSLFGHEEVSSSARVSPVSTLLTVVWSLDIVLVFDETQTLNCCLVHERGVA